MDPVERELRDTLADDRLSLTVRPDATTLLRQGVRRRRHHRAVATVAAAVVLVAGALTATSFVVRSGLGTERVVPPVGGGTPTPPDKPNLPASVVDEVPWAQIGYDYRKPPVFPGAVADPSVPWCRADQLTLSQSFQGATGNLVGTVSVANESSAPCALQGQPAVHIVASDGSDLVASVPEPFYVDAWIRVDPGASASAAVEWMQQYCGARVPAHIAIGLPHGGGSLSAPFTGQPACDSPVPTTSRLVVDGFLTRQGPPFTPEAGLSARIGKADASAAAGAIVGYRLQLQSTDAPSVALDPCLPFRERLVNTATHKVIEEDHLLNCDAAPQTITGPQSMHFTYFDIQIAVPADAPPGDYSLVWQSVLKPVAAVADDVVHITAPPPECRPDQLTASAGRGGAATGHYGLVIVLHNVSSTACSLRGYPGVGLLDRDGRDMTPAPRRGSAFVFDDPGPTTVVLDALTGVASFEIGGEDYDPVHETECRSATRIAVYAPDSRRRLVVDAGFPSCAGGTTFSAVVAGRLGPRG